MRRALLALSLLCVWAMPVSASRIRLKDGTTLPGTIVTQDAREVVVQFEFGTMSFAPGEVRVIEDAPQPPETPVTTPETTPPPDTAPPEPANLPPSPSSAPLTDDTAAKSRAASSVAAAPEVTLAQAIKGVATIKLVTADGGQGAASGIIINPHGIILTNYHVVNGMKTITVVLAEERVSRFKEAREYSATVLKTSPYYDMALIAIHASTPDYLHLASEKGLKVGDEVKAIGNPFGLSVTVSQGIVSAIRTNFQMHVPYVAVPGESMSEREFEDMTWIQTDASINPGNSGGPLLNAANEVIGMNTFGMAPQGVTVGLNFALHVKHLRRFAAGRYKSSYQNTPRPRWAEVRGSQGARSVAYAQTSTRATSPSTSLGTRAERSRSTSNAAQRHRSAQPAVGPWVAAAGPAAGVAPPWRSAATTPSSSRLGREARAHATRLARYFDRSSK
ncbi:MAG: trypsin-like peptidase domain-containing protein [Candidatus Omnitrophica bacterium]|nr:trypsin-like peptidase domain-containing protein [Candidatus Omnitrophota bacterium]